VVRIQQPIAQCHVPFGGSADVSRVLITLNHDSLVRSKVEDKITNTVHPVSKLKKTHEARVEKKQVGGDTPSPPEFKPRFKIYMCLIKAEYIPLGLVYFSDIFIPERCRDMWGFNVYQILSNPLKYTLPKILYHEGEFFI
jgi:hypothetical protein